ncbi:single-stranded DNA-binding protein [Saccharicrinis fermentans]|uniref:Single-stranded DNA-binding protein n=1 Tax=Saccharicrinis fermentans DSM 9555 = JCM 21142 TaxID=869213 RepID=W7Y9Z1_9BACT|nr:single-stranded DNA-binding protein [Saccharicrinis fermentans]GAF05137.1 helix-destabilizing protein [Saccharicrinis fermentans DSM 9555 = JCM 21142]
MLKLILCGNVGNDATVKETGNGKVVNFNVAVSKNYKNSKGEKVEKTEWIRAAIWRGKDSDIKFAEYIKKGKKILIEGEPHSSGYQNKDGEVQSGLEVTVKEFEFLN